MSNSTQPPANHRVLNLVSTCLDIIGLLICVTFLSIITYRLIRARHPRGQPSIKVPLILSMNILCVITMKSILQIVHVTVPTIRLDFQLEMEVEETFACRFRSYALWTTICLLYWGYVLLAFFRFARVICPKQLWLHRSSLYLFVLIPAQTVLISLCNVPTLVLFDSTHLIPNEAYCAPPVQPIYSMVYQSVISFFIPYSLLCIFYLWIGRRTRLSTGRVLQERNRRDFTVMRRMLLNSFVLSAVTVPFFIIFVINAAQNRLDPIIYRVQWLSSSASSCLFALLLPLVTTQIRNYLKPNRLIPGAHRT